MKPPLTVLYEGCDEIKHTSERPFCEDWKCPCHRDLEYLRENLAQPYFEGLLTLDEWSRIFYGQQIEYGNITPIN